MHAEKTKNVDKCRATKHTWKVLTADEYDVLGELKMNGVHHTEICKILDIPYSQYKSIMCGITTNEDILAYRKKYPSAIRDTSTHRIWSLAEINLLKQLQEEGWFLEDIADVFGLTSAKVRSKLNYLGVSSQEIKTRSKEERNQKNVDKKETLKWLNTEIAEAEETLKRLDTAIAGAKEDIEQINTECVKKNEELEKLNRKIQKLSSSDTTKGYHPAVKLIADHLNNMKSVYFDEKVMQEFMLQYGTYKECSITTVLKRNPKYLDFLFKSDLKVVLAIAVAFMNNPSANFLKVANKSGK